MPSAVSAGHEITLEVAKTILKDGGNAFDAAIAAYLAMFITEPCMASAGGNGFALIKPHQKPIQFLDFFCQTPRSKKVDNPEFYPIVVNFGTETEEFHVGLGSACVPGAIAAIFAIHKNYATIPLNVLTQQAKDLAQEGVLLNTFQAYDLELLKDFFAIDDSVKDIFFNKNGNIKKEGDLLRFPEMADFLEFIEREGRAGFYHGEIGQRIAQDCKERGGFLQREDFENYEARITSPLNIPWGKNMLSLPNGPSKGGVAMATMLYYLEHENDSIPQAARKAQELIANPTDIPLKFERLYTDSSIDFSSTSDAFNGTSHFNILDKKGNAICLTSSIGEGSGYFIPGTNMHLNNMLGELFLLPNGAHSWKPNVRLNSMMTPTMLCNDKGDIEFISGSGGASRIPYAIGQVLNQLYKNKMELREATEAGRYHYQDQTFQVEGGAKAFGLPNENVWDSKSLYFGGVHSILNRDGKLQAIGDDRRYGVAEVF